MRVLGARALLLALGAAGLALGRCRDGAPRGAWGLVRGGSDGSGGQSPTRSTLSLASVLKDTVLESLADPRAEDSIDQGQLVRTFASVLRDTPEPVPVRTLASVLRDKVMETLPEKMKEDDIDQVKMVKSLASVLRDPPAPVPVQSLASVLRDKVLESFPDDPLTGGGIDQAKLVRSFASVLRDAARETPGTPSTRSASKDQGGAGPGGEGAKDKALEDATSLVDRLSNALADKVKGLVVPMLHFGDELNARLQTATRQLDETLGDLNASVGTDEARETLVRRCATAAVDPLVEHVSRLQAQYRLRFHDRFAAVLGGADDFEERTAALLKDSLGGMRAAARAAIPEEFADVPLDAAVSKRLGLPASSSLRSVTEKFINELESELLENVDDRREGGAVVKGIIGDAEKSEENARLRRRFKYILAQGVALGLNYVQYLHTRHTVMWENREREANWPRLPLF